MRHLGFLSAFIVLLAGCSGDGGSTLAPGACVNSTDCPDGFLCLEEACKQVECTTSDECGIEQYCSAAFSCIDGCQQDTDCLAGYECNSQTSTCVQYGCRDTQLDCNYGETCDVTSGACIADTRPHCQTCDISDVWGNACGNTSECVAFAADSCQTNADCDPGYKCDAFVGGRYCHQDFCLVKCRPGAETDECPRGLECGDIYGEGSLNACYGDCEWLLENGL